jgi:hypothetical protein
VSERVDFSVNASVYDRRHGAVISDDGLGRLWSAARLRVGASVLDVGAGTGRVAVPLAIRGCQQLERLRFVREAAVEMGPGAEISIREFLRRLVEGELSYIWGVPEPVRTVCLPILGRWAEERFDLDRPIPMPRDVRWTIHRKHA